MLPERHSLLFRSQIFSLCRIKKIDNIRSSFNVIHGILLPCTQVNAQKKELYTEGWGKKGKEEEMESEPSL